MPEVNLTVKIDMVEIDEAMQKLQRFYELIKEANSLVKELASTDLKLNIKF